MSKQQIHFNDRVFSIQYQLPPLFTANVDKLKSLELTNIINLKNDNYQIIDQKTQLNYYVSFSSEYISFNFVKAELVNYDIDILIQSLKEKLYYQHIIVDRLFSTIKKMNYSYIKEIEYSPTNLSIEIEYGKMMDVRYQISAFIFNPLFEQPSNKNPTKVYITNQTFKDPNCKIQNIFKNHPMNLGMANTFQIDQFVDYLHKTYIPMQILTHRLTDPSLISQISQYMLTLHPTKSFAILILAPNYEKISLWFGAEPLIISINSLYENNKLRLELDPGAVYYTLQGFQKNNDYQQFQFFIKKVIAKWDFETLNEVDEFFNKFLLYLFSYFLLSASKEKLISLLLKASFERIESILKKLIQKIASLQIYYFSRIQERGDYLNQLKKYFHYFIERNIKLNEIIIQFEQGGTFFGEIVEIVQCLLEKQEKRFSELIKLQFKEEDFKIFVDRYNYIQQNQGLFQFNVRHKRYVFNTIEKKILKEQDDMPTQTWPYEQFPESELKIIKDEI